ncbi:sperm surface protein Sp17 [Apteryx rowi]|uniref:sperm surface protein Sp17 n=1 Tax=Apteryx rowi TaxID=308060 RepID=UPI000E1CEE39|nr:sperm surface protein Sp17 [Apteryx rowi]
MAVPFSNTHLRVPAGFRNLLEGLAREVLRAQPRDVVGFAAEHFRALLEEREREWPGCIPPLPEEQEAPPELRLREETLEKRREEAAATIQAAYRSFRARREAEPRDSWA